jgi:hypothetical protein
MKLIVNREVDLKRKTEIRRNFAKRGHEKAYMLLLELLSHQSGFSTTQEWLRKQLDWTDKVWKTEAKKLEDNGHLFRYRQTGTNNWTFVVYETPQTGVKRKEKKIEEFLDECKKVKSEKKKELPLYVPEMPENCSFTEEEWVIIYTKKYENEQKNRK